MSALSGERLGAVIERSVSDEANQPWGALSKVGCFRALTMTG